MNAEIDKLTKEAFDDIASAFKKLELLRMNLLNLKIEGGRSKDAETGRIIASVVEIYSASINEAEALTGLAKNKIKEIAVINKKDQTDLDTIQELTSTISNRSLISVAVPKENLHPKTSPTYEKIQAVKRLLKESDN